MKTIEEILNEYTMRRTAAEAIASRAKSELLAACPEIAALEEQKRDALTDSLLLTITQPARAKEIRCETEEKVSEIEAQIDALFAEKGLEGNIAPKYTCPECGDTAYIDGKPCRCFMRRIYTEYLGGKELNTLPTFADWDKSVFSGEMAERAAKRKAALTRFAETDDYIFAVFSGEAGQGKSFSAACIANRASELGRDVLYIDAFTLFELFRAHRFGEFRELSVIENAPLLVIDDLGIEPLTRGVTVEYFFRLVDYRRNKRLPMVITTNLKKEAFVERYTEMTASRLFDKDLGFLAEFGGRDMRIN